MDPRWPPLFRAAAILSLLGLAQGSCSKPPPPRDFLTILLPDDVVTLDPNQEVESVTDSVLFNVYEPLVTFDANLNVRTLLADSWEHPEPERWRFHLRRDVRFHDGTPLTAGLVRDGLQTVQKGAHLEASDFLSQIAQIAAVDDHTVDIVTREARAILANLPVLYVTKRNAASGFPPLVGTGPYRIRDWRPGQRITVERWPGYWGPAPEFREVAFVPVPDAQARFKRLEEGSADIIYWVSPEHATMQVRGARFLHRPGVSISYLTFNLRRTPGNPFLDLRVRTAFHLGVNRDELVDQVLRGRGTAATQPIPASVFGYDPELARPARDPARARALLAQAGYAKGLRVRLDFGQSRQADARLLQQQLQEIGVDLELNPMERHAVFERAKAGKSDLVLTGWNLSSGEASEFYEFCLHTPSSRYGFGNYGAYSSPAIDEIAERNGAVLDQRERRRMLQHAAAISMKELPVVPLYVEDDIYGVRDDLSFDPRLDSEIRLLDVKRVSPTRP